VCHSADLKGMGDAPALTGNQFSRSWDGHSVDNLYEVILTSMPKGNAGSLTPGQYADIVAYLFKSNNFPAGAGELRGDPEMLKAITIAIRRN